MQQDLTLALRAQVGRGILKHLRIGCAARCRLLVGGLPTPILHFIDAAPLVIVT